MRQNLPTVQILRDESSTLRSFPSAKFSRDENSGIQTMKA